MKPDILSVDLGSSLLADPVGQSTPVATGQRPIALQECTMYIDETILQQILLPCVRGTALALPLALPTAPTGGRGMGGLLLSGVSPILFNWRYSGNR